MELEVYEVLFCRMTPATPIENYLCFFLPHELNTVLGTGAWRYRCVIFMSVSTRDARSGDSCFKLKPRTIQVCLVFISSDEGV
jgi:hypothetical protein